MINEYLYKKEIHVKGERGPILDSMKEVTDSGASFRGIPDLYLSKPAHLRESKVHSMRKNGKEDEDFRGSR